MTTTADSPGTTYDAPPPGLAAELEAAVEGEVAFDDYSRHLFSRDASMYAIRPLGVVYPRHADDVAAAVASPRATTCTSPRAARAPASRARPSARAWCSTSRGT